MAGLRCSMCGETWPLLDKYQKCPQCKRETDPFENARPTYTESDADSIRSHVKFEEFYAKHDKKDVTKRLTLTDDEAARFTLSNWKAEINQALSSV